MTLFCGVTMTEADVSRANMLIQSRDSIEYFLECRDIGSDLMKSRLASQYEHVRKDAKKTPGAVMSEIGITDASSFDEDCPDTLERFYISRDVLERALKHELERIAADLAELGILPDTEIPASPDTATASDTPRTASQSDTGKSED